MDIIESNWGIANTYPNRIELNKHLKDFPKLREKIITHELEHAKAKSWIANRKVDAFTEIKFKDLIPFIKKHPKALFQQYLPITYSKYDNTIYFEWTLILLYLLGTGVLYLIYKFISVFATNSHLFWQIMKNIAIIGAIILFLYWVGKKLRNYTSKIDWKKNKKKLTKKQKQLKRLGINPEALG